jgi:hypothetical protein
MTVINENQWVYYFGFQRFPFDRPEAGNEEFARPDFLASCFVEPKGFERVFGQADSPVTSLLFAARGTGKTACRVMMDYYCQNGLARPGQSKSSDPNFVLSIPHIRLDNVRAIARLASTDKNPPEILVEHHVIEIMRQAMPAFVNLIAGTPTLAVKTKQLSIAEFEDLSLFVIFYSAYLTSSQKNFLRDLGVNLPPLSSPMMGFLGREISQERPPTWESVLYEQRLGASPLDHLERWAKLMPALGIKATYVLVDGVDELMESAESHDYAHSLIRPLLTHLRLMDGTNRFALKFFLPSDVEKPILSDPAFRKDRGFVIQRIEWQKDDLVRILRERLNAIRRSDYEIRDRTAAGFDALCVPELRGQIEENIVSHVNGNPRQLMNFCALMVATHCNREIPLIQDDPYQLDRNDYETARQVFSVDPVHSYEIVSKKRLDILSLITQGESEMLEFKSSMRYDYKRKTINKEELGLVIAKTVAGFMNRAGGILVIGVDDEGNILGIENDIETLTKKSLDGFQLAFKDIVRSFLGLEQLARVHLFFETLNGHSVCAVQMEKSPIPVYVKNGNDNEFYVRMLNSTIKLSLPETVSYIRSQWG